MIQYESLSWVVYHVFSLGVLLWSFVISDVDSSCCCTGQPKQTHFLLFLLFFFLCFCIFFFFFEMHFCVSFFLLWCVFRGVCVFRKKFNWIINIYIDQFEEFMFYNMLYMYLRDSLIFLCKLPLVNYVSKKIK